MIRDWRGHGHDNRSLYEMVQWSMTKDGHWKIDQIMVIMASS